jgi:membrane protein required for colicin V production
MNWLDALLLVILIWSMASSFRKGLTREILGIASVVLGLLLGLWLYGTAGSFLIPYMSSRSLANLLGFFIVFFGVLLLGSVAGYVIGRFWKVTGLSIVDHALGALFGAVRGTLISVALIMGIMAFAQGGRPPESVVRSRMAPYVVDAAHVIASVAPHEIREGFRKSYEQVKAAWAKALHGELPAAPATKDKK